MKKLLFVLMAAASMFVADAFSVSAQSRYGIIGGINFSTTNVKNLNRGNMTQWHAGFTYKLDLPLGFSFQPSLVYNVKGAKVGAAEEARFDLTMGYVEVPLSFQWGPDLLLFRPFIDVTPYIGYAVNNKLVGVTSADICNKWTNLQRFEYGLGIGAGLEIWRFQVIGRYNWNFGSLYDAKGDFSGEPWDVVGNMFSKNNFGGVTLSVAFLFGGGRNRK